MRGINYVLIAGTTGFAGNWLTDSIVKQLKDYFPRLISDIIPEDDSNWRRRKRCNELILVK